MQSSLDRASSFTACLRVAPDWGGRLAAKAAFRFVSAEVTGLRSNIRLSLAAG